MIRVITAAAIASALLAAPLFAQESRYSGIPTPEAYYPHTRTVLVGAEHGYPPYSIVNEAQEADGFSVQLMNAALHAMGYQAAYITGPWTEIKQALADGTIQALPLVGRTPEREALYDFTFPYLTMHGTILVEENRNDILDLSDLAGTQVAVLKGDNSEEFARRSSLNAEIITTDTFEKAIIGLSAGQYDAVIIQKLLAYQLMGELGITNLKTAGLPLTDFTQAFCFAVDDGDQELLAILNEGLSIVIADGTFRNLYTRWFGAIERQARQFDHIIVGGGLDYPPYEYLDENGQPTGFNTELTRAIARTLNIPVEVVLMPWTEARSGIAGKTIDILQGLMYTVDRDEELDFSPPHSMVSHVIATRKGEQEYASLAELAGKTILVQEGDIMHETALSMGYKDEESAGDKDSSEGDGSGDDDNNENSGSSEGAGSRGLLIVKSDQQEVLRSLLEGEADAALVAEVQAHYWIEQNGWKKLKIGSIAITSPEYGYAVHPDNHEILMLFSEGLAALMSSGEYREIYTKWLGKYEPKPQTFWQTFGMVISIALPLLLLSGLLVYLWFRSLRKQVRKQTQEILEQKNLLEHITDTSPIGITMIDGSGQFIFANPAAGKILGAAPEEIVRRTLTDPRWGNTDISGSPIPDGQHPPQIAQKQHAPVIGFRQWITRNSGERRLLSINASPLERESGDTAGAVTTLSDITDQHLAALALAQEKEKLAVTLHSIGDGVITTDTDRRVQIMNRVAEELTGWTQNEAFGRRFEEIFTLLPQKNPDNQGEDPIATVLDSGEVYELTVQRMLTSRDGTERIISNSAAPIRDSLGNVIGVVLVFRDQTKEQKMIEYIQRTAKLDSLGILAGGIAHDFNNLLGGVFGYVEMAKVSTEDPQAVSDYLSEAMKAFDRAKDLTLQLLTFSKGGVPSLQHGSLESVIRKSASLTLSGSRSTCSFDIPEDLWPCRFDQNQIGQVLDNLIINAQQAMPNGGKITIKAANSSLADNQVPGLPEGSYIRISISDTGEGIPAALMEKVFDPFFSTKPQGSGLGLATSYSIIKKHQGIIDISSRVGQGSVVTFYLPKAADDTSNIIMDEPAAEHAGEGIFVVMDDESIIRDIAGAMLTSMGYKVREAACGEDVLDLCRDLHETGEPVAGVILDLTIPGGMGGRETVLECRKEYPELPIFASSGYSEDPIMANPAEFGFTASISKPYTREDLAALLEHFIKPGREQAPQQS